MQCLPRIATLLFGLFALVAQPALGTPQVLPALNHLALELRIDYAAERLDGAATLIVRNGGDESMSQIPLLLNRLLRVESVIDADGKTLAFGQQVVVFEDLGKWQVAAIRVELPSPLAPGGDTQLQVRFGGHLAPYTETGMLYLRDHINRDFTLLREDALAFPKIGVPSMQANRTAPPQRFGYELALTVPERLVVANGGELMGKSTNDGETTWRYRSREPAPFLLAAIAPYGLLEDGDLRVFYLPGDEAGATMVLKAARRAANRFDAVFGPIGKPLALGIMQIPEGWGSQASLAGGIIQDSAAFRDRSQLSQLYHELSHLWNAPDLDAPSPRWNEGLAMFLQGLLSRELDRWDGEEAALQRAATWLLAQCGEGQPCGRVPLRGYGRKRLTDYSYSVARLMFAAFYRTLGEEAFDRALRTHFQAHKAQGGGTDDLVKAFVAVGGAPAQRIFDDWLDSTAWLVRLRETGSVQSLLENYRD